MAVAESLCKQNKTLERPVGRPPKRLSTEEVRNPRGKVAAVPTPQRDIRTDGVAHWPAVKDKKNNCRHCKVGTVRVVCTKCKVHLCLTNERNCFYNFHH